MSFILEALRKSERERQQKASPGIGDVGFRPQEKSSNRWVIIVVAVLAINAVLVAGLLLRDRTNQPQEATRTVQPASLPLSEPAPARRPAITAPKREDVRPLEEEVPDPDEQKPVPAVVAMARQEVPTAAPTQAPARAPAPARPPSSSPGVPTMEELVLSGNLEMSPLRLDIHVYSEQRGQRFVFINMSKYREGDSIKEGPRVETITTDGVVLSHQGNNFLLTR